MVSKMTEQTKKQNNKKYKYTKQIIKLAIDNGFKHPEIAKKAGLSEKSIAQVSRWKNGEALATERQMQFFINEFEHSLKRKMEHLFYSETETQHEFTYHKIKGEILLTHTLYYRRDIGKSNKKSGIYRYIIINSDNVFHLLKQKKVGLNIDGSNYREISDKPQFCSNEQANWYLVETYKHLSPQDLVDSIDSIVATYCNSKSYLCNIIYKEALPLKFIVRQFLLKNGHALNDIVDL
jgi:transcriptional regulator with XRE-family HTH domain